MAERLMEVASRAGQDAIAKAITDSLGFTLENATESQVAANSAALSAEQAANFADNALNVENDVRDMYNKIIAQYGYPFTASSSSQMTDTSKIYVYTGNNSGNFIKGNWYYHNGTSWTSGGVFNSEALETDKTLSIEDMAADAKVVGNIVTQSDAMPFLFSDRDQSNGGVSWQKIGNDIIVSGTASGTQLFRIYYNETSLPSGMTAGKTYWLELESDQVYCQIHYFVSGSSDIHVITYTNSSSIIHLPDDAVGLSIRFCATNGLTINETIHFALYKECPSSILKKMCNYGSMLLDPKFNEISDIYTKFVVGTISAANPEIVTTRQRIVSPMFAPLEKPMTIRVKDGVSLRLILYANNVIDENNYDYDFKDIRTVTIPPNFYYIIVLKYNDNRIVYDLFDLAMSIYAPTDFAVGSSSKDSFYESAERASYITRFDVGDISQFSSILTLHLGRISYWFTPIKDITIESDKLDFKVAVLNGDTLEYYNNNGNWKTKETLVAGNVYYIWAALRENHDATIDPEEVKHWIHEEEGGSEKEISQLEQVYSSINPMSSYYKMFVNNYIVTTGGSIQIGGPAKERRSVIVHLDKPTYLYLDNVNYLFRMYYYNENNEYISVAWTRILEIPSGVDVGISIKRADSATMDDSELPQLSILPINLLEKPRDYFFDEIEDTISKVRKYNTEPSLVYFISTDHHTMSIQGSLVKYDTIFDMVANMRYVAKEINIDANVCLGDVSDMKWNNTSEMFDRYGIINDTPEQADDIFEHWLRFAMMQIRTVHNNLIYVAGNHDDNRYINRDRLQESVSEYDYTPEEMYSYYTSLAVNNKVLNPNNNTEYYVDYDSLKIRVICMNSNYYNKPDTSSYPYTNAWWYGFSDSTVSWVQNVLNNVPSGWQVLILTHMSPEKLNNADNIEYRNMTAVKNVIQSFIDNGGQIIGEIYGHSHCDWMTTTPWLDISLNCQKCQNSTSQYSNMQNLTHPQRTRGTASEDSWNVVLVKPQSKRLDIIRFGAGTDKFIHYEDMTITNDEDLVSIFDNVSEWSSNNTSVATVDSTGVVTPVAKGRVMITAKDAEGNTEHWSIVVF